VLSDDNLHSVVSYSRDDVWNTDAASMHIDFLDPDYNDFCLDLLVSH
jgi:hypothetical protein